MKTPAADRPSFLLLAAVLLVAFLCGGGGIGAALGNLAVQLAALVALAVRRESFTAFWRESPRALRALVILSLALPLAQIIPLPESLWTTLPAGPLVERALEQAGGGGGWMPASVNPLRTLLALSALVTPLGIICAGWTLPRERLIDLGWIVVGLGLVTVLLALVQLGARGDEGTLYGARSPGKLLLGTFANRNSTGLFLTFALGLAALLPVPRPHPALLPARLGVCLLLLVATGLTQSRTAIVLALLPVLLGLARAAGALLHRRNTPSAARAAMIGFGALALVGAGGGMLVVAAPGRIGEAIERFEAKDDPRRFIWDDATYSAERYWPVGTGMGTFDEIYLVNESLENLTLRRAGRAHNDYLELAIEAGAAGIALAGLWLVLVAWLTWRARTSQLRWAAWAGSGFLLAIALQSITDYPLRNQTILAMAGFALLMLARIAAPGPKPAAATEASA
ncbi:O-antigen ligase family protein [Porphyrobacter sp. AAP82]|uniref:O-antigen ligase family protein n=1 Tax=Porphyrobacter sp. AAP82 TaxID=1248917 RepID=UPI0002E866A4|nr:O-antigen ligase family protein [Porphyrobacter sp. AAP82]